MNSTNNIEEILFSLPGGGGKTFEAMRAKDAEIGSVHKSFKSIHIAGTNGKSSVATKIATVLQNQGLKVGLYTSPHIWSFQERIQVNGKLIPVDTAARFLDRTFDRDLSFFDVLTLMAFLYFEEQKVDYAVIETGLGGKFDATNVITPELSIITSIGFDHMSILGNSLEEIAAQKAGIIKPNVPYIVGPTAGRFFPEAETVLNEPFFDLENCSLAKLALQKLGIDSEDGLKTRPPFRFQKNGKLVFDPAHNVSAFERLLEAFRFYYPEKKHPFYLAFSRNKDWQACVNTILPIASTVRMIRSDHPFLRKTYPGFEIVEPKEVVEGVVAGSFYILSEFIKF